MYNTEHRQSGSADFMIRGIEYVCRHFKKRSAGSASERASQRYFSSELKQWADAVAEESFPLHPHAFLGWTVMAGILGILSVAFFWLRGGSVLLPVLSAVAVALSAAMYFFEFVLYRRFVDFLFPKSRSVNVMAVRNPSGEVRRRIIFGGHADAAYELRYIRGRGKLAKPILTGAVMGMLLILVCNAALLIRTLTGGPIPMEGFWTVAGIAELFLCPFFAAVMFFVNWNCIVDGANDNLSGCYVAMGVLRDMALGDVRFENTQVCCLITGAEEAGLRGSLAYARKHRKELSRVETIFIAVDTLREIRHLQVYTLGQNGLIRNSAAVGDLLRRAGRLCGIELPEAKPYPGATDAEAFSRHGLQSCALCGADHEPQPYYHTRHDTFDNVSGDCLDLALMICKQAAVLFDRRGLAAAAAVRETMPIPSTPTEILSANAPIAQDALR